MGNWLDTYPHKIYASVLLFNGRIIDYKIGQNYWKDSFQVTLRGQISIDDLFKSKTKYTYWEVNSKEEHKNVFEIFAKEWIENQQS